MSSPQPLPKISDELLGSLAEAEGVCVRPLLHRVTDTTSGRTQLVPIQCSSTREAVCPPCANPNRRLRMQQGREGWHLDSEPEAVHDVDGLPRAPRTSIPTTAGTCVSGCGGYG